MKVDAVVLANGEYPAAAPPLQILADAPYVICCDGGADEYIRNGHIPNLIIGDGDSISEENRKKYGYLLHRISEQDTNDQTKAVNYLLSQGKRRIAIVGATGKREDHTLGNISLLMDYMRAGADVRTYTDHGVFYPLPGHTYLCLPAGAASIHHQLQCPQPAWAWFGISSQRLHQLVAGHSQRMYRDRIYD